MLWRLSACMATIQPCRFWPKARPIPGGAGFMFEMTSPSAAPAIEVVRRIGALFEIERSINGKCPKERLAVRRNLSRPLVDNLRVYMREQAAGLSRGHDLVKAVNYMLKRWPAFTLFLEDGRVCLSNNAAERGLRGIALGRKSWLFCGSDRGGRRAAAMYSLICLL